MRQRVTNAALAVKRKQQRKNLGNASILLLVILGVFLLWRPTQIEDYNYLYVQTTSTTASSLRSSHEENQEFLAKKSESSQTKTTKLIQIGANDGIKGNVKMVDQILRSSSSEAVLVEGNPALFDLLTQNIKKHYDTTAQRIRPLNALICKEGSDTMPFYVVDIAKLEKRLPTQTSIPHWVRYQISSLNKQSV